MKEFGSARGISLGAVTAVVYSLIFWSAAITCDVIANLHRDGFYSNSAGCLIYVSVIVPAVFACLYTVIEKKCSRQTTAEFNLSFFVSSVFAAVVWYLILNGVIVPLLVIFYHENVNYGGDMFSGLARNLEGIQFVFYFIFYCLGSAAALIIRGIVYLIEKARKKNMY